MHLWDCFFSAVSCLLAIMAMPVSYFRSSKNSLHLSPDLWLHPGNSVLATRTVWTVWFIMGRSSVHCSHLELPALATGCSSTFRITPELWQPKTSSRSKISPHWGHLPQQCSPLPFGYILANGSTRKRIEREGDRDRGRQRETETESGIETERGK